MGVRALWIAFGGAIAYILTAVAIPTVIVVLRTRGIDIADSQTAAITKIGALWAAVLGAYLGWRHARKLESRRT